MTEARHVVAVVGGATAGAEVAARLSERGAEVVVLDQGVRPFGKVEDGLPRWHVGLRRKEYGVITAKLSLPRVHVVPLTRLGRDLDFKDLVENWGFSAVVLASGAWRDRPLPVPDAERYVGRGVVYQNPLVIAYNHQHDPAYTGPRFVIEDGVAVVGGGLASIDVVKLHMLETVRARLAARGIPLPHLEEMEQAGIPATLGRLGLTLDELGVRGATLYYRRRIEDMPLAEIPADATAEKRARVEGSRRKIVEKAVEKFRFHVEPLCAPEALVVEGDRVVGLRLRRQEVREGTVVPPESLFEHRCAYVVSAIGSIPEPIPGVAMRGELYAFEDRDTGRIPPYAHVFSTGNVVTGKGNIVASRKHAQGLAEHFTERYLGLAEGGAVDRGGNAEFGTRTAEHVAEHLGRVPRLAPDVVERILARVHARQAAVGYPGTLAAWLQAHPVPPDEAPR